MREIDKETNQDIKILLIQTMCEMCSHNCLGYSPGNCETIDHTLNLANTLLEVKKK